jgi:hypothetical protein
MKSGDPLADTSRWRPVKNIGLQLEITKGSKLEVNGESEIIDTGSGLYT